jgi:signal transduction histidine kinase
MSIPILPSRGERLIAWARLMLAAGALLAVWIDPAGPPAAARVYMLLGAYVIFAVAMLPLSLVRSSRTLSPVVSQIIDLTFISVIIAMSEGPASPYYAFLTFALCCAAIRFRLRGLAVTAAAIWTIFAVIGAGTALLRPEQLDLNYLIVRLIHLGVVAFLFIFLVSYYRRVQDDLTRLASWGRRSYSAIEPLVTDYLCEAGDLLRAPRVGITWTQGGSDIGYLAVRSSGSWSVELDEAGILRLLRDSTGGNVLQISDAPGNAHWSGGAGSISAHPIPEELREALTFESLLAIPFGDNSVRGAVFFFDIAEVSPDVQGFGALVGGFIHPRLEQQYRSIEAEQAAALRERIRVGRDLHDSLLQSLTGAALQLQSLHTMLVRDPAAAQERIREIQSIVANDQRELRWLISRLQPNPAEGDEDETLLSDRFGRLRERFQMQWGLQVNLQLDSALQQLPRQMRHDVFSIASEAVANAAKHSGATAVAVEVRLQPEAVSLVVEDNGRGFPFHGRLDLQTMRATRRGPMALKERITLMGGDLTIDSAPTGARLEVKAPILRQGGKRADQTIDR